MHFRRKITEGDETGESILKKAIDKPEQQAYNTTHKENLRVRVVSVRKYSGREPQAVELRRVWCGEWAYEGSVKGGCRVASDGISTRYQGSAHDGAWNERAIFRQSGWYRRSI